MLRRGGRGHRGLRDEAARQRGRRHRGRRGEAARHRRRTALVLRFELADAALEEQELVLLLARRDQQLRDRVLQLRQLARDACELLGELRWLGRGGRDRRGRAAGLTRWRARRLGCHRSVPEHSAPREDEAHHDQAEDDESHGRWFAVTVTISAGPEAGARDSSLAIIYRLHGNSTRPRQTL